MDLPVYQFLPITLCPTAWQSQEEPGSTLVKSNLPSDTYRHCPGPLSVFSGLSSHKRGAPLLPPLNIFSHKHLDIQWPHSRSIANTFVFFNVFKNFGKLFVFSKCCFMKTTMFCGKGTASFVMNEVLDQDGENYIYSRIHFQSLPLSTPLFSVHLRLMIVLFLNKKEGQGESSAFAALHQENDDDSYGGAFFLILWSYQNYLSRFAVSTTHFLFTGLQFHGILEFSGCILCCFFIFPLSFVKGLNLPRS